LSDAEPPRDCPLCPRLAAYRHQNRREHPDWWNGPAPSFGDERARLLIVGLAPGRAGANRTGRPFTGDFAGVLLYETLIKSGFARGRYGARPDDGKRIDRHAGFKASGRMHLGARGAAFGAEQRRRAQHVGKQFARHSNEGRIRMRGLENGNARRQRSGKARPDQTGAGARYRGITEIFGVVEKGQVGRPGGIERRDVPDAAIGGNAFAQLGARQRGDVAGGQLASGSDRVGHPAVRSKAQSAIRKGGSRSCVKIMRNKPSEFGAAAEGEPLRAVIRTFGDRIGEVEAQRPER